MEQHEPPSFANLISTGAAENCNAPFAVGDKTSHTAKLALQLGTASVHSGYGALRLFVALVLLVAAGLKCHQLATEPILGKGFLDSRWLLIATVEFELFFGLWLLANILPKPTWTAALCCFGLFTCISLYKALSGYATCGCFGRVQVNPWYTSTFDLAIVLSLLRWRPCGEFSLSPVRLPPFALVVSLWLFLGLPAGIAMGSYSDTTLSDVGDIIGNGKIVVLEPEKWVGKRFPLLDYIDIGDKLKDGEWLVLLYHHDCPKCQEAIRKLQKGIGQAADTQRVALIEMPPYDSNMGTSLAEEPAIFRGQLSNARKWSASTPETMTLNHGQIIEVNNRSLR